MLQEYLAELSRVRLLEPDEERSLWRALKDEGSRESRQRLIEAYQPLVFKIALRLATDEGLCIELVQEGTLGLIEAVEGFIPDREVRFSTYAQYRIRGRMLDFLRRRSRPSPYALELAHWEGEVGEFLDLVQDERVNLEEEVDRRAMCELLQKALERLNVKERQIVEGIYLRDRTPQEVAVELGISASYLYKTQKRALRRLRGMLAKNRAEIKSLG
ncbi:MAG: sigma-70 family RNA polymerase sigma factor [Bacteroidota bacterium]